MAEGPEDADHVEPDHVDHVESDHVESDHDWHLLADGSYLSPERTIRSRSSDHET